MSTKTTTATPSGKAPTTRVLSARVPAELAAKFSEVAAQNGYLNESDAVRDVVRQYLAKHTPQSPLRSGFGKLKS